MCFHKASRIVNLIANQYLISVTILLQSTLHFPIFSRYNKTPVIKASGRELCYMLLTGILCCYCMSFIILAPPQKWTCASLRIGIGLCLSICYSSIFIKTNRISRIFNQGVKSIQRPLYTSPISQVAISSGKRESLGSEIICVSIYIFQIINNCMELALLLLHE
jgi:branched-subunit amino acid transport protein AzlD